MTTDYKVAEVELSYRNRVPNKDRKKIMDSYSAYKILRNNYSDDTIDYRETFKVIIKVVKFLDASLSQRVE